MQKPHIISAKSQSEYFFKEGCYITEISNHAQDPELSIAQARVEAGVQTRLHKLIDTSERYYILSGTGELHVEGLPVQQVTPGDTVFIPPNCAQSIKNNGQHDLVFLVFCTPRFLEDCYCDLEND